MTYINSRGGDSSTVWQMNEAAAANVPGTGVGLAMVQLVAKSHGGDVTVESTPGAGATFTLFLPAASVGAAALSEQKAGGPGSSVRTSNFTSNA